MKTMFKIFLYLYVSLCSFSVYTKTDIKQKHGKVHPIYTHITSVLYANIYTKYANKQNIQPIKIRFLYSSS